MNCYHLRQVVKRYGDRTVLAIDELEIEAGRTLAILGPSGAGKSTLLRLLGFLESADEGSLFFEGRKMENGWPDLAARRRVTMLFQRPALLNTTVWNNVACGLSLRSRKDKRKVQEVLDQLRMSHLRNARATTLSGGEAQRVAWRAPSSFSPRSSFLTSQRLISTRRMFCSLKKRFGSYGQGARPSLSLRTTSSRRAAWPTVSRCC